MKNIHRVSIGVDFGGTFIKAAIVTSQGKILSRERVNTVAGSSKDALIQKLEGIIHSVKPNGKKDNHEISGIGIGVPGNVDSDRGMVKWTTNVKSFVQVPLKNILEKTFSLPVYLDNDANAAARGEFLFGAGKKFNSIVCITLGTGVGGGIILNNSLIRGTDWIGGEIGHMILDSGGPLCNCGSYGCLEMFSSATAVVREAHTRISSGADTVLTERMGKSNGKLTAEMIGKAAAMGDSLSISVLEKAGRYLGMGIVTLFNIIDPDVVVVGGGLMGAGDFILKPAIEEAQKRAFGKIALEKRIIRAQLGKDAGIIGAASYFL